MPYRLMAVQATTGPDTDDGRRWISMVVFDQSGTTACWHGRSLTRSPDQEDLFRDADTGHDYRITEPRRTDPHPRGGTATPTVDLDARDAYEVYLAGGPLPGTPAKS